ncbi:hypothetical protein SKAU_G00045420 [Synaphobranchus kaupii]|uniref:Uncharacterized protein n=1 Tax=Synaphobranchus kaupii TaxID=118154 RepID=A0A9Q1G2X3_SYNKA|nr:hypothetical protein SKAU_G00045420 [Synaphobranchus kaupii]
MYFLAFEYDTRTSRALVQEDGGRRQPRPPSLFLYQGYRRLQDMDKPKMTAATKTKSPDSSRLTEPPTVHPPHPTGTVRRIGYVAQVWEL